MDSRSADRASRNNLPGEPMTDKFLAWVDKNYRFVMLAMMSAELLLLVVLVLEDWRR